MIIGQASKPKNLKSDIVKKGEGPERLPRARFTFNMALKFRPVVVTALLICDPLFSV